MNLEYMKLNEQARTPHRAHDIDAGLDLSIDHNVRIAVNQRYKASTGIAVSIPEGYVGYVNPRSGLSSKYGLTVINAPGTLDPGYQGEVIVPLINLGDAPIQLHAGHRIAQLVLHPIVVPALKHVERFSTTSERGTAGFGSTGVHNEH